MGTNQRYSPLTLSENQAEEGREALSERTKGVPLAEMKSTAYFDLGAALSRPSQCWQLVHRRVTPAEERTSLPSSAVPFASEESPLSGIVGIPGLVN